MMSLWDRWWFRPERAETLAVMRIVAAGIVLWILFSRDLAAISGLPSVYWSGVSESTRLRFLAFPGHSDLERVLSWAARISALCAMAGLWPRLSSLVTALLVYHLAPLESIIWTPAPYARGLTLPVLALLLAAASPSGDALSLSAMRTGFSDRYGWPVRLMQMFLAQVYVFSGLAKLRTSGVAWSAGANLRNWMLLATQNESVAVHTGPGGWLAGHSWLMSLGGIATLGFELGFIAALWHWRGRYVLAASAIVFHAVICYSMNITFNSWPLLVIFVDWAAVRDRLDTAGNSAVRLTPSSSR